MNQSNEHNFNWKGNQAGNRAIHVWVKKRFIHIKFCQHCGKEKKLDLANKTGIYNRSLKNWLMLCRSCHRKFDKRPSPMIGKKKSLESKRKTSESIKLWWAKRKENPLKYLEKYL